MYNMIYDNVRKCLISPYHDEICIQDLEMCRNLIPVSKILAIKLKYLKLKELKSL